MRRVSLPANQYVQFGNVQIVEHTVSVDIRDPGIGDGGGALIHAESTVTSMVRSPIASPPTTSVIVISCGGRW